MSRSTRGGAWTEVAAALGDDDATGSLSDAGGGGPVVGGAGGAEGAAGGDAAVSGDGGASGAATGVGNGGPADPSAGGGTSSDGAPGGTRVPAGWASVRAAITPVTAPAADAGSADDLSGVLPTGWSSLRGALLSGAGGAGDGGPGDGSAGDGSAGDGGATTGDAEGLGGRTIRKRRRSAARGAGPSGAAEDPSRRAKAQAGSGSQRRPTRRASNNTPDIAEPVSGGDGVAAGGSATRSSGTAVGGTPGPAAPVIASAVVPVTARPGRRTRALAARSGGAALVGTEAATGGGASGSVANEADAAAVGGGRTSAALEPDDGGARHRVPPRRRLIGAGAVVVVIAVVLGVLAATGTFAGSSGLPPGVALQVNSQKLSVADFTTQLGARQTLYGITPPAKSDTAKYGAYLRDAAHAEAVSLLLDQVAPAQGVSVSTQSAEAYLDALIQSQDGGSQSTFAEELGAAGLNESQVLAEVTQDLLYQKLFSKIAGSPVVTQAQIEAYFNAHRASLAVPETRVIDLIVVSSQSTASAILGKLKGGASFASLASQSLDTSSASNGGKLGTYAKDDLQSGFADAAFSATVGVPFGPVANGSNYEIGEVTAVHPASAASLTANNTAAAIKTILTDQAQDSAWDGWLAGQLKAAHIRYAPAYQPTNPDQPPTIPLPTLTGETLANVGAASSSSATGSSAGGSSTGGPSAGGSGASGASSAGGAATGAGTPGG